MPGYTGDNCDGTCTEGPFGAECNRTCSIGCNDTCNPVDGSCSCKPGYTGDTCDEMCLGSYGRDCSSDCSTGCRATCDPVDGRCSCKPGYTGDMCDQRCMKGKYGEDCNDFCSQGCMLSSMCDPVTGRCLICKRGWTHSNMKGRCDKLCSKGSYGRDCSSTCGTGCRGTCDSVDGRCSCKPGYTGDTCDKRCSRGKYGEDCNDFCSQGCIPFSMCDPVTGECLICKPGWTHSNMKGRCDKQCANGSYGESCMSRCSTGCRDTCNKVDGSCSCKPGYDGNMCQYPCRPGSYGNYCSSGCSTGCIDRCNSVDGRCDCKPGYEGKKCQDFCRNGTYGAECNSTCSDGCNTVCNPINGSCTCKPSWYGAVCDLMEEPIGEDQANADRQGGECPTEEFNTTVGFFSISRTPVDETFSTPELCDVVKQPLGEVRCFADGQGGGNWGNFTPNRACDYSDLNQSNISDNLSELLKSDEDIEEVIQATVNIIKNETLNELDVLLNTNIMEKTTNLSQVSSQVAVGVLTIYNKVIETPESTLTDLQARAAATNRILRIVDDVTGKIKPGPTGTVRISTETSVSEVWDLTNPNVTNEDLPIGISLSSTVDNQTSSLGSVYNKSVDYSQTDAAILLPRNFLLTLQNDSKGKDIRMSMNVYKDPLLFTKSSTNDIKYRLNSKVVAAKILVNGVEISDLGTDRVTMIFSPTKVDTGASKTCGYWDFSLSGWSTDGCVHSQGESGRDVCTCDHLTNFAVLLNLDGGADVHSLPLSVITIIGLSLSILGLSGTLLSFIMFRKLREKLPQQTLFNLALAELCSWLIFLAGITQTQSHAGCTLVAILLHYFLLASFLWMLAEAFLHYLLLVKVQAQEALNTRYMCKTGVLAWGLPLIAVIVVLAVDPSLYRGNDSHCWMSVTTSLYAFALPVGVVILFNIIIYIMVVVSIFKVSKGRAQGTRGNRKRELLKIRVPALLFVLFGLSWVFGYMAVFDAKVVFQYLFCLASSTQGFLIFIFFTARNEEVRQLWSRLCCKKKQGRLVQVGKKEASVASNMATSKVTSETTGATDETSV